MNASDKATVYVETSVVSYLTARPSRDIVVLAHQELTRRWWEVKRPQYQLVISDFVLQEAARGDAEAAARRLDALSGIAVLDAHEEDVVKLAGFYLSRIPLPPRALIDAAHIAMAAIHGIDYLLTWNCAHLSSGFVRRRLRELDTESGFTSPIICTPEELLDEDRPETLD